MQDGAGPCQFVGNPMGMTAFRAEWQEAKYCLFSIKEGSKQRPALPGPYCMDLLVAWEALSILLPMASTSFPIPLIVLQEERARAAASVKRADLIFISRILTCFRFLVNEPASSNLL